MAKASWLESVKERKAIEGTNIRRMPIR
jgi:hypothetical protein